MYRPARAKKRPKKKLADLVRFTKKKPPAETPKPRRPSKEMPDTGDRRSSKEKRHGRLARGLAQASAAMPGGKYSGIVKAGLAGASAGATIDEAYAAYKRERKATAKAKSKDTATKAALRRRKKGRAAKTTVDKSPGAQKAQYHWRDATSTEKV
jgi:hypothetical protein